MTIIRQKCIEGFLDYASNRLDTELCVLYHSDFTVLPDDEVQALITEYLEETYGYSK